MSIPENRSLLMDASSIHGRPLGNNCEPKLISLEEPAIAFAFLCRRAIAGSIRDTKSAP